MAIYNYEIKHPSTELMVNIENLAVGFPAPRRQAINHTTQVAMADGSIRNQGLPRQVWHWDYLLTTQYAILKGLFPATSTATTIRTKSNLDAWVYYNCTLTWPAREPEHDAGVVKDINIELNYLV